MGAGRADVVPERIDPELRAALKERAKPDNMTRRKVIRTQHKRTSRSAQVNPTPVATSAAMASMSASASFRPDGVV